MSPVHQKTTRDDVAEEESQSISHCWLEVLMGSGHEHLMSCDHWIFLEKIFETCK